MGHEVKLISPSFVRPFVKSNKTGVADARTFRSGREFVTFLGLVPQ